MSWEHFEEVGRGNSVDSSSVNESPHICGHPGGKSCRQLERIKFRR